MKLKKSTMIKAECKEMCPDQEFNMRVKNNIVNILEKKHIENNKIQYMLVKEYSRPAAGKVIRPTDLRTLDTLIRTCNYLVKEVYNRYDVEFIQIYEYLFDRFRAIRQDLIIQRCNEPDAINILSTILRFYLISDYKLCFYKNYDEFMNFQHLSEVLQTIISHETENRALFYSVFMLININSLNTEIAALKQFKQLRNQEPLASTIRLVVSYLQGNYVRLFRIYKQLPLLCQLAFHRRIPSIECSMINKYNAAFSFKNSKYPATHFYELTLIEGKNNLRKYADCKLISMDHEENILFSKQNANISCLKDSRQNYRFIDENLNKTIETKFLLGN